MTTQTLPISETTKEEFQTGEVMTIVGGHFVHDTFPAFLSALLPTLIDKLALSLTLAGSLQFFIQLPALLNPFIGYFADKVSLRYFVILAPAITATMMSSIGLAPSYTSLAIILFVAGVSTACFHAPAPAMISRISGKQVGKGMSLFMAGGELGRTVGPLLAAGAVAIWTLEGIYPVMVLGWVASLILYWRLRHVPAKTAKSQNIWAMLPTLRRVFIPMTLIIFFRAFMLEPLTVYLPTLMDLKGASLTEANLALTLWELAGVGGALLGGTLSDRLGRKTVLFFTILIAPFLTFLFLQSSGLFTMLTLLLHGLISLSTTPVLMAITQEHLPYNRAVSNGLFISIAFLLRPLVAVIIGYLGDTYSLEAAYFWGAMFSFLAIPAIFFLPTLEREG